MDPDPGGSKTCGSGGSGSRFGSGTLMAGTRYLQIETSQNSPTPYRKSKTPAIRCHLFVRIKVTDPVFWNAPSGTFFSIQMTNFFSFFYEKVKLHGVLSDVR
jgi:hypothetical protein